MDNPAFEGEKSSQKECNSSHANKRDQGLEIKRKVGLWSGVAFIISRVIGTGIFVTPGIVLKQAGSVGLALVICAACGLVSVIEALVYTELGMLIPKSGGSYSYLMDGMASLHPFWGPLPAFIYSSVVIVLLRPVGLAVGCLIIAQYTVHPLWVTLNICTIDDGNKDMLLKLTALLYLGLLSAINCYNVDWAIRATNFFTGAKLGALGLLICCGIYNLSLGNVEHLMRGFEGSTTDFGSVALAFYAGLWPYAGWNSLNNIMEELKDPHRNLLRALMISIFGVTIVYLSVNIAYLAVLSPEEMISSEAVAVDVANRLLGPMAFLIPLGVIFSAFGSQLTGLFSSGRVYFASAREGHLMNVLSHVHVESRAPVPALVLTSSMAVIMIISRDVTQLINFSSAVGWIFYILVMMIVIIMRWTRPNAHRPFKVPLIIPVLLIIMGSYLMIAPIITQPSTDHIYMLVAIFISFLIYIPFVYYKWSFSWIDKFTHIIQLMMYVGPAAKPDFEKE